MTEENQEPVEELEAVVEESQEEVVEEQPVAPEPPKPTGYIDYEALPEDVRDTVKMRVDGDFRKNKEAERKLKEADRKIKEYEDKLAEFQKPKEVAAPNPDDAYDDPDKFKSQYEAHQEYLKSQSDWQVQEQLKQHQQAERERLAAHERQQNFLKKTESAGINQQELGYAASVVAPQVTPELEGYLLEHDYGPQLLVQLAKNPMELQELASLNPMQVGVKLEAMATAFKPTKRTSAPPPDEPIQGSGVNATEDYPVLKGSTIS
jgi:hypothetical protein